MKTHFFLSSIVLSIALIMLPRIMVAQDNPTEILAGTSTIDKYGFEMVYIPAGTFEMGITAEDFTQLWHENSISIDNQSLIYEKNYGVLDVYTVSLEGFWIDKLRSDNRAISCG